MKHALLNFNDFNLAEALLKALEDLKFKEPSPVQEKTIPLLLEGRDVIAQAQTGTGKTAAFALPILQRLVPTSHTQALILAPTRELAIQVAEQFSLLGNYLQVKVSVLCGGQDYRPQLKQLREGAQIVVGTPGRVLDHLNRGTLNLTHLNTFVLDEADEMLRMGFIEDVETILKELPEKKQIALFSATMPTRIRSIAESYLSQPAKVEIKSATATVQAIEQRFLFVPQKDKPEALFRVLAVENYQGVMVFVRTKSSTEEVASYLQQQGLRAMAIHGDLTQALREKIIAQFRQGAIDILVATDVAARGLDVDRVTHVINYDVPHDSETYVHRIGRTGRAGRRGITVLFITPKESRILNLIERHTRQRIEKIAIPNDHKIQASKQERFMESIKARLSHEHVPSYQHLVERFLKENEVEPTAVAAALALLLHQDKPWATELPKLERSQHSPEKKMRSPRKSSMESSHKHFRADYPQELFKLNVGSNHGVKPSNIVGAIANEGGLESRYITGLKIHAEHSLVRLPQGMSKEIFQGLSKAWVCGRQLKLTSLGTA